MHKIPLCVIGIFHAAEAYSGLDVAVIITAAADKSTKFPGFPGVIHAGFQLVIAGVGLYTIYADRDDLREK